MEEISTRNCFRCKGMVVLDPGHIRILPDVLMQARHYLTKAKFDDQEDQDAIFNVMNSLLVYHNILDSVIEYDRES